MKLTSAEYKKLKSKRKPPKKPSVKKWKKCSYCAEPIKCAVVTELRIPGVYHPGCIKHMKNG